MAFLGLPAPAGFSKGQPFFLLPILVGRVAVCSDLSLSLDLIAGGQASFS